MRVVERPHMQVRTSQTGQERNITVTVLEVEEGDVGSSRSDYLGYQHQIMKFGRGDVARRIEVLSDSTGWTCWTFCPSPHLQSIAGEESDE